MGPSYSLLLWIVSHCYWLPEPKSLPSKERMGAGCERMVASRSFPAEELSAASSQDGRAAAAERPAPSLSTTSLHREHAPPPTSGGGFTQNLSKVKWRLRTIMISYRNIYFLHALKCVYFLQVAHIFNAHRIYLWWTELINPFVIYGTINRPSVHILVHYKYILICTCTTQHSITCMNCKNCVCNIVLQN